jgi:hypothetical protein
MSMAKDKNIRRLLTNRPRPWPNMYEPNIGFQIMILARPEGGIRVRRAYKYVVEDSDR